MPLLGAGWLSGFAVTKLIGLSRILNSTSSCARVAAGKKVSSLGSPSGEERCKY